jgi:UDP:flavonoid glycosyltransferase YjiC (YdhE family)
MRILFGFVGGNGHFQPLVPIARAAQDAGHTVAVTGAAAIAPMISAAGFTGFPSGPNAVASHERLPMLPVDREREHRDLREGFARRTAPLRAADVLELCVEWRPDLVVCDEFDFGAMVAAEHLGLPHATVRVTFAGTFLLPSVVAEPLQELRAQYGLPPDPSMAMLRGDLELSPFPDDSAFSFHPKEDAPPPITVPDDVPTVYFTLGTIFNTESGDLFTRVLSGLRELPVHLVVTTGNQVDPAEFGPQPPHVRIERYLPQSAVLPRCSVVVSHGGSGTVVGALAHGVPLVVVPMGADQPDNAARCVELGVGVELDALQVTPSEVRDAVARVLADPSYREAALGIRDTIATLPDQNAVVALLEQL